MKLYIPVIYLIYLQKNNEIFTSISPQRFVTNEELEIAHTQQFVKDIHESKTKIAKAAEMILLNALPIHLLQNSLVIPFKWQTAGSVLAAHQALLHKWSINLGGGFHHASSATAEGFCLMADISLIFKYLWEKVDPNLKFMIVDLDAHQGLI